jgi:hypothetical protein
LFRLARANLSLFRPECQRLDLEEVLMMIEEWLGALEGSEYQVNPLMKKVPNLRLLCADKGGGEKPE